MYISVDSFAVDCCNDNKWGIRYLLLLLQMMVNYNNNLRLATFYVPFVPVIDNFNECVGVCGGWKTFVIANGFCRFHPKKGIYLHVHMMQNL